VADTDGKKRETPGKVPRRLWEKPLSRFLHVYWRFARGVTLGVRALVVNGAGEIFLVQHSYVSGWHLPGGGVEIGETVWQALTRELLEEGNIALTEPPRLHGVFFNRNASRRDHVAVFIVDAFRQDAPPLPNREITACGFFPLDGLPDDTTAATRARIAEVFLRMPVRERW
jgi:ADP-ribose pyrophosphatase YjhB (NUDIX family)